MSIPITKMFIRLDLSSSWYFKFIGADLPSSVFCFKLSTRLLECVEHVDTERSAMILTALRDFLQLLLDKVQVKDLGMVLNIIFVLLLSRLCNLLYRRSRAAWLA
jgi:hypothetical protein